MGGDFIEGAINGFITAGLNHALHQMCKGSSGPDDPPWKQRKLAGKACVIVDLGINIYRAAERDITWTSAMMRTGMS